MSPAVYKIVSPSANYLFDAEARLAELSAAELIAAYNLMSGKDVKRFSDRKTGEHRLWAVALTNGPFVVAPPAPDLVKNPPRQPKIKKAGESKPKEPRVRRFRLPLGGPDAILPPREARPGTKRAAILAKLRTVGITFDGVKALVSWDDITAYQGIRLINTNLGWRLFTDEDGTIHADNTVGTVPVASAKVA